MKKFVFLLILVGAISAGSTYYYRVKKGKEIAAEAATQTTQQKTETVKRGTIDLKVPTTGKVVSNLDVEIKSKASGQITQLPFDISDTVTSGALLAVLDPVDENRNVAQRAAQLDASKARLVQAEQNLEMSQMDVDTGTSTAMAALEASRIKFKEVSSRMSRQRDLYAKRLISSEEFDILRSELSTAENNLRQAEVRVEELKNLPRTVELRKQDVILNKVNVDTAEIEMDNARQRLQETKIYAPMNGVITARPVQEGQIIASGISNVGGGTSLMTLSDISRLFVNADVDESDIGKIKEGQKVAITADAFPGKRFSGEVVRVAAKGVTNSNVVTFEVKIEISKDGLIYLKPEMTTNVEIQADRRENILILPNEYIQFDRTGNYFVDKETSSSTTEKTIVQTGITDGINTEVLSGLKEGDTVAIAGESTSRWARPEGGSSAGGSSSTGRSMQRAAFTMSGAGRGGRR